MTCTYPISTDEETPSPLGQLQRCTAQRRLAVLGERVPEVLAVDRVGAGKVGQGGALRGHLREWVVWEVGEEM
jgi:hypothetical protein